MEGESGDVLGKLPRTRPGKRSEKRAAAARPAKGAAARPPRTPPPGETPSRRQDPVSDVLGVAARVADSGVRAAGGVAREVLRRLPRP